jgi:hypothetical protein
MENFNELKEIAKECGISIGELTQPHKEDDLIECEVIDRVTAYVIGKNSEVPTSIMENNDCQSIRYAKKFFKHGNPKLEGPLDIDAMRLNRERNVPEARKRSAEEIERIIAKQESDRRIQQTSSGLYKLINNRVELLKHPDNTTTLQISGKEAIKNLQLDDAQTGDVFGFQLTSCENGKLTFKLVKIKQ